MTDTRPTRRELEARDGIIAALEPLAPVDRLRVMAAVATMLGHYELAAELLIRLARAEGKLEGHSAGRSSSLPIGRSSTSQGIQ